MLRRAGTGAGMRTLCLLLSAVLCSVAVARMPEADMNRIRQHTVQPPPFPVLSITLPDACRYLSEPANSHEHPCNPTGGMWPGMEQARFDGELRVNDGIMYSSETRQKTALDSEHKGVLEISQRPEHFVWVSDERRIGGARACLCLAKALTSLAWGLQTLYDSAVEDATDRLSVGSIAVPIGDVKSAASGRDKVCSTAWQKWCLDWALPSSVLMHGPTSSACRRAGHALRERDECRGELALFSV